MGIKKLVMTLLLTILTLILAIMTLSNQRVMLTVKLALTTLTALVVYKCLFGEYKIWYNDDYWTEENITHFFRFTFPKCIVSMAVVYGAYYVLVKWILIRVIIFFNKILKKRYVEIQKQMGEKYSRVLFKIVSRKTTKYLVSKFGSVEINDMPTYKEFISEISKGITFVLHIMTVWLLYYGFSAIYVVSIILVCFIAIALLYFAPLYQINNDIKETISNQLKLPAK
jgi:hypothetical protein